MDKREPVTAAQVQAGETEPLNGAQRTERVAWATARTSSGGGKRVQSEP